MYFCRLARNNEKLKQNIFKIASENKRDESTKNSRTTVS